MTATLDTATLADVVDFVGSKADATDIDRIIAAVNARSKHLRAVRAASVSVGSAVTLDNLTPKYLNGLTGTVTYIRGQRADVTLDETSTQNLRFYGTKFFIPADTKNYVLHGCPLSSCTTA